jgi:hypothetical protein
VAINRATGYIGTARTPLTSAAGNAMASVEVPEITLRPPNLKIWAERISTVEQGMTQGAVRQHVIGSEGAGLTSDTTITLYTEWLDSDGSALPTELGLDGGEQFGLTGRLAKIVAPNTLAATAIVSSTTIGGSVLSEFPIAPGRRTQALQIGSNLSQAEHFYIHVVGTPKDADPPPNFAIGDAVAPYDSRPRRFTPFLVPLFEEASTMADYNAYRQLQARDNPPEDLKNPPPTYVWQFRPEYPFSQFDLDMRAIERVTGLGTPQEERSDILNTQTPVIASSDDLIQALYSLIGNQFDRLTPIDGKQELLLALGETETLVELGQDKTLRFSNLQSLASLNPEDFLTMRLYTNNDAGNVLWEYAMDSPIIVYPRRDTEIQRSTRIDAPNNWLCEGQAFLPFVLRRNARVTLQVAGTTLFSNQTYVKAVRHEVELPVQAAGLYDFKLTAVDEVTGRVESVTGHYLNNATAMNALPIGHAIEEGIDLYSGPSRAERNGCVYPWTRGGAGFCTQLQQQ